MNGKLITWIALAVAIVAAAVASICVSFNRANVSRARAAAEASAADRAEAEKRKAEKEEAAEQAKARAAEAKAREAADNRAAKVEERKAAEEATKAAQANARAKEADARKAQAESEAAKAKREEAAAKAKEASLTRETATKNALAETKKAEAEAALLAREKEKADKVIAEAKLLELRKIDFQTYAQELQEWRRDLEEREAILKPEKTIADLAWAGGTEDSVIDEKGNVKKQVKTVYDPEKDMEIPAESRILARAERLRGEAFGAEAEKTKRAVIASIERLYVEALKEGNVINAKFYKDNIKAIYPDWEFKGENQK